MASRITPRQQNYAKWYQDIIREGNLAEHSPVRGCMVIKPNGYALWENIRNALDNEFKKTGHQNAYFPLFIPKSFLSQEASHVEGFAKECAVVTHSRLKSNDKGGVCVDPTSRLEEELIVRPTSETIIWTMYREWIQSYRDLPILLNQWANVVRWELRPRLFLRTMEFLWQEGHTAHATADEALTETRKMLDVYHQFIEQYLGMALLCGSKSKMERFAGAEETYCVEALMQDGRALQAGTSHFLGQNFAKAFNVKYQDIEGKQQYVWATSWGVSTRLIGGLIMTHSDDKGLVLPPSVAPVQVVIVPIWHGDDYKTELLAYVTRIKNVLETQNIRIKVDDRGHYRPGWKFTQHELEGVCIRITIGKRDLENQTLEVTPRHTLQKETIDIKDMSENLIELALLIKEKLKTQQQQLFDNSRHYLHNNIHDVDSFDALKDIAQTGGIAFAHWDGTSDTENYIKKETNMTIRCIPFKPTEKGYCIVSKKPSQSRVYFARAY